MGVKFLEAATALILAIVDVWTGLPRELRVATEDGFTPTAQDRSTVTTRRPFLPSTGYKKPTAVPEAQQEGIQHWIRSEIESTSTSPKGDPATRLYGALRKTTSTLSPIDSARRQVNLVQFRQLRKEFRQNFTGSWNKDPLATYISTAWFDLPGSDPRLQSLGPAGERLGHVAMALGGFGALLLPHSIARWTPEKHMPVEGQGFTLIIHSLQEQGLCCNDNTKLYYDLARELFEMRAHERDAFITNLRQAALPDQQNSRQQSVMQIPIRKLPIRQCSTDSPTSSQYSEQALEAEAASHGRIDSLAMLWHAAVAHDNTTSGGTFDASSTACHAVANTCNNLFTWMHMGHCEWRIQPYERNRYLEKCYRSNAFRSRAPAALFFTTRHTI
ncbi:hypothetical protein B0J13DRAFT_522001 [Dactylonectria estremocensis]|uniref:Uncharacterized protein n=1 Tax=Dactylonectria estremocensis TaxID=1079267 RepID=A0A9P9F8X3_9HYPO|nr:hypothetical protein B0J13DRAFT_522001 [Dactylonectria estremocensis]